MTAADDSGPCCPSSISRRIASSFCCAMVFIFCSCCSAVLRRFKSELALSPWLCDIAVDGLLWEAAGPEESRCRVRSSLSRFSSSETRRSTSIWDQRSYLATFASNSSRRGARDSFHCNKFCLLCCECSSSFLSLSHRDSEANSAFCKTNVNGTRNQSKRECAYLQVGQLAIEHSDPLLHLIHRHVSVSSGSLLAE